MRCEWLLWFYKEKASNESIWYTNQGDWKCFQPTNPLDQREETTSYWNLDNLDMAKIWIVITLLLLLPFNVEIYAIYMINTILICDISNAKVHIKYWIWILKRFEMKEYL